MPRPWILFVVVTIASGAIFALVTARAPHLETLMIPPFWWPLFVALAFELMLRPKIISGDLPDTTVSVRAIAVVGGAITYQALRFIVPTF